MDEKEKRKKCAMRKIADGGGYILLRENLVNDWRSFLTSFPHLKFYFAFILLVVYGGRLVYGNFFIDSEIMIIRPEYMRYV